MKQGVPFLRVHQTAKLIARPWRCSPWFAVIAIGQNSSIVTMGAEITHPRRLTCKGTYILCTHVACLAFAGWLRISLLPFSLVSGFWPKSLSFYCPLNPGLCLMTAPFSSFGVFLFFFSAHTRMPSILSLTISHNILDHPTPAALTYFVAQSTMVHGPKL
ncbi:hypothetical protein BD289DRAFT_35808 [Coniella lustricola]|uniref:Uncharacterized protein n=1 Tax=Coniella lustricola TaxID=2025994 RepID=A0A2T3A2A1_9PEZI|nr:hypothetical protein BD289DRAFT_35808 [Coniella lustricola]